jgi:SAM-dependent methyltransferase
VLAWGRVRAERDFFNAVSIHVHIANRSVDSTATLKLYTSDDRVVVRESHRRTLAYDTDSWVLFVFDSICESESREYLFSIETDAEHEAIEVWEASRGQVECRTHYFKSLANLFDPLLARRGQLLPDIPDYLERYLDRHVYQCVNLRRYFFARLLHLADAIGRVDEPITDALAIGVGVGYQEAFLAGRFPYMHVLATDLEKQIVDFPMPNLEFETLDLLDPPGSERFDFVFSIECLEHIEDYETAFRHKSALVRPGGYLYVSVPFASREEQRDQDLRKQVWEQNQHYTPGFSFEDLEQLFAENNLEVLHAANMFHLEVMLPLRHIIDRISSAELEAGVKEIAQLYMLDLKDERVESYRQAEGIRFLGRKRSS